MWVVKLKGIDGEHKVLDVVAPALDAEDQGNTYVLEGLGAVHQSDVVDYYPQAA